MPKPAPNWANGICAAVTVCSGPQWTVPGKLFGSTWGKLAPNVTTPGLPVLAIPVAAGETFPTPGTEEKKIHFFYLKNYIWTNNVLPVSWPPGKPLKAALPKLLLLFAIEIVCCYWYVNEGKKMSIHNFR